MLMFLLYMPRSLLKQCFWKGMAIDCSAIFKTFPTDRYCKWKFKNETIISDSAFHFLGECAVRST